MEEAHDFSLDGKAAVTEANLRDEYYWRLVADFIGPQSGEGLQLESAPCRNRLLIQVGLMREDNNFPWIAITDWLKRIFPSHYSADFRCLIERGIATTLSLGRDAMLTFLESNVNFNFVGPICDSIGVEREHLLEMRDFSEQAKSIEVTNGLILELSNFITREKIAPVILVLWLRNFNSEFCKDGNIQKSYRILKTQIKKLKKSYRNYETRSHRRNTAMEGLLQSPFELVRKKPDVRRLVVKKRVRKNDTKFDKVVIKEEESSYEISTGGVTKITLKEDQDAGDDAFRDKGEALTLLDIAMRSVQKLSSMYSGNTEACQQVSLDLLKNQYALTCKEHPAMAEFEKKLDSLKDVISLASPVVFLHSNASCLADIHDAVEQQIIIFEREITQSTGEKLGRDRLPEFSKFVNLSESATSRYIHMAQDILSPSGPDIHNYRNYWVAFCDEKRNPSKLRAKHSNQVNSHFEAAAGLIHHHQEISLFFSDMLSLSNDACPNIILESVAADASDSIIQSLVCVLAIVYCKVLGPYWQLLTSGSEYSHFCKYVLGLYQRFLDWSKDPSTLLEPEGDTNVFLQYPLQENTFTGVFHYCGQWHTNRELIRACLKRTVKVIASVTEEHLKDFLPGGKYSQIPPPDLASELVSCTFSVLMAEYPFSLSQEKKPAKGPSCNYLASVSDNSQGGDDGSKSSDDSGEDSGLQASNSDHSPPLKKKRRRESWIFDATQEVQDESIDLDYVSATVERNGGPCKSQQDVDKMMLRFDGKSKAEKLEAIRYEILYQKLILNNTDPSLNCVFYNISQMLMKLRFALPRVKPGYSLVLAPRKTRVRYVRRGLEEAPAAPSEPSVLEP